MLETLRDWATIAGPWGVPILGLAAFFEYVFPPFPGDTVLLVGASVAAVGLQPWWAVFLATVAGSMAGCAVDYFAGRWLGRKAERAPEHPAHLRFLSRDRIHRFEAAYRRHGRLYILLNRFVPGVRAVFFLVAGASGMPFGEVLIFGTLSAAMWCGLVLGAGWAVGRNLEMLEDLFQQYTTVAWIVLALVVAALIARWAIRRVRARVQ